MGNPAGSRDRYEHLRHLLDGAGEGLRREVNGDLVEFLRSAPRRLRQLEILHSLGMLAQLRVCAKALAESAERVGATGMAAASAELEALESCGPGSAEKLEAASREYLAVEKSLLRLFREMRLEA